MRKFMLGILLGGLLLSGGWFSYAAIQSEVGISLYDSVSASWKKINGTTLGNAGGFSPSDWGLFVINKPFYPEDTGTSYDQACGMGSTDSVSATTGCNKPLTASIVFGLDGSSTWTAGRVLTPSSDTNSQVNLLYTASLGLLSDGGSNWMRMKGTDATSLSASTTQGAVLTAPVSTWSVTNTPAANAQATASKAAGGAGVSHVATSITVCFSGTAVAAPVTVNLRDGATGAGTVLRSWTLGISAINESRCVDLSGLAMIGTANTAMTIEFAGAGGANTQETVTLTGYSVS